MALDFDGIADRLNLTAPKNNVPLSISCRVNTDDVSGSGFCMSLREAGDHFVRMGFKGGFFHARARDGGGNTNLDIAGPSTGVWYVMTYTEAAGGASRVLYANGSSVSNTASKTYNNFTDLQIAYLVNTGDRYNGKGAELAVWDGELDSDEAAELDAGASPLLVRPSGLTFYADLIRDVFDYSRAATITTTGSPAVFAHPGVVYPAPKLYSFPTAAAPPGLSIPIAMHHYKQLMGAN